MTNGGPGRWNDQSMVRLDTFVSGIRDGTVLDDVNFELLACNKEVSLKNCISVVHIILWIMAI